jgi:hypothetical protein
VLGGHYGELDSPCVFHPGQLAAKQQCTCCGQFSRRSLECVGDSGSAAALAAATATRNGRWWFDLLQWQLCVLQTHWQRDVTRDMMLPCRLLNCWWCLASTQQCTICC